MIELLALRHSEAGSVGSWLIVAIAAVFPIVGAVRYRSWWRGVGELAETKRRDDPDRFGYTARLGYAFLPLTVGALLLFMAVVLLNVGGLSGRLGLEIMGGILVILALVAWAWAFKEYRRPSEWLPAPAWLREYERRHGRWKGGVPWRIW